MQKNMGLMSYTAGLCTTVHRSTAADVSLIRLSVDRKFSLFDRQILTGTEKMEGHLSPGQTNLENKEVYSRAQV